MSKLPGDKTRLYVRDAATPRRQVILREADRQAEKLHSALLAIDAVIKSKELTVGDEARLKAAAEIASQINF